MSLRTDCSIHHLLPFLNWTWHSSSNWQLPPLPKPLAKDRFLPLPDTMTDFKSLQHLLSFSASYHMPDRSCNFGPLLSGPPDSNWQKHWKHRHRHLIYTKKRRLPIQAGITYSRTTLSRQGHLVLEKTKKQPNNWMNSLAAPGDKSLTWGRQHAWRFSVSAPRESNRKTCDSSVCRGLSISLSIIRG